MAKKSGKKAPKKKTPVKAATKAVKAKKTVRKPVKAKAAKTATRKFASKASAPKKTAQKKLSAKVAAKITKAAAHPVAPAPPPAASHTPTPEFSMPAAPASQAAEVYINRGAVMAQGFQPGQRVRHRYEHWWGTIVRKADTTNDTMAPLAPVRYVVTVDGGKHRDDIRPEDLTVS